MTNAPTAALAAFIASASVPATVREKARKPFIDTIGAMLSGAGSEVAAPLDHYLRSQCSNGASPVLGTIYRAAPELAAFVNGTFGHALDFDDGIVSAPVHPSSVVIAALLADPRGLDGRALLDAYVVGVEVAVKLAVGIGIDHYHHGWHGTGTLGIFGAIAALAHVRRLEPAVTQVAFGLAASMASGIQCNFGTMTKPLHTGWAARNAVAAVTLASAGFSATPDALEAENGFFAVYGSAASDLAGVAAALGKPYAVDDPGLSLKRYACCYASHRPIVGLLAVKRELQLTPENVASIRCVLAPGSLRALIYPDPKNGLEGKFSLEYALAAGVLDDAYTLWTFGDEAVQRPAVRPLLARIAVAEDSRCAVGDPHAATRGPSRRGFVEVHATTADGRHAVQRVDVLPGSPEQELTWEDVRAKFLDCAQAAQLDPARAQSALDHLMQLDANTDVEALLKRLQR